MQLIFFGCTKYSRSLLEFLLKKNLSIKAIFGSPEYFSISYSNKKVKNYNYYDLSIIAKKYKIPYYEVDSVPGKKINDYEDIIIKHKPDIILVLGWYYMVPKRIRDIAVYGAWGIHASLLPKYAGGAPLVWAIINGEKETGVTLFKLDDGVDDGDIIAQEKISINDDDTIKEVYSKSIIASKSVLNYVINNIDKINFIKQDKDKIEVFPQRKPEDGEINLNLNAVEIYNFIRAQSNPYPGAFIKTKDNKKLIIEKARVESIDVSKSK